MMCAACPASLWSEAGALSSAVSALQGTGLVRDRAEGRRSRAGFAVTVLGCRLYIRARRLGLGAAVRASG